MKDFQKENIKETLQTVAKLELMLKMCDVYDVKNLDDIKEILWSKLKEPS